MHSKIGAAGSSWRSAEPVCWGRFTDSCRERGRSGWLKGSGRWWRCDAGGWRENQVEASSGKRSKVRLYIKTQKKRCESGSFSIEAAKRLTGADLAARERHGLKGPFETELGLGVWLLRHVWVIAGVFLFVNSFISHKRPARRSSPSS